MNTTTKIVLVVLLIIVLGFVYWIWGRGNAPANTVVPTATSSSQGLGSDIYNKVAPNPASNLPETNPFKAVQTNPFGQ